MKPEGPDPVVSICLPNLNTGKYLEECIQSALHQTFQDFEILISDNYSDDGSWEIIQKYVNQDDRIRAYQSPREGMYANWNNTLREARGEYIYILTSDDLMVPDCLEKMVAALEAHPECDIATCKLVTIDEEGRAKDDAWERYDATRFLGPLLNVNHVRRAPSDFPLHLLFGSLIISITQILVRRTALSCVGTFRTDLGSEADLEWHARASWFLNKVHVPEFLATWRRTRHQATGEGKREGALHYRRLWKNTYPAIKKIDPTAGQSKSINWAIPYQYNEISQRIRESRNVYEKCLVLCEGTFYTPYGALIYFHRYLRGIKNIPGDNREWLENVRLRIGIEKELCFPNGIRRSLDIYDAFSRYLRTNLPKYN